MVNASVLCGLIERISSMEPKEPAIFGTCRSRHPLMDDGMLSMRRLVG
jgi:hypothetical protein